MKVSTLAKIINDDINKTTYFIQQWFYSGGMEYYKPLTNTTGSNPWASCTPDAITKLLRDTLFEKPSSPINMKTAEEQHYTSGVRSMSTGRLQPNKYRILLMR